MHWGGLSPAHLVEGAVVSVPREGVVLPHLRCNVHRTFTVCDVVVVHYMQCTALALTQAEPAWLRTRGPHLPHEEVPETSQGGVNPQCTDTRTARTLSLHVHACLHRVHQVAALGADLDVSVLLHQWESLVDFLHHAGRQAHLSVWKDEPVAGQTMPQAPPVSGRTHSRTVAQSSPAPNCKGYAGSSGVARQKAVRHASMAQRTPNPMLSVAAGSVS